LFTGKTPDFFSVRYLAFTFMCILLKKGHFPLLYNLPIHTILLTMSLTNIYYCDILFYMSKNVRFSKNPQISTQKVKDFNRD